MAQVIRLRAWLAITAAAIGAIFIGRCWGATSLADIAAVANAEQVHRFQHPYLKVMAALRSQATTARLLGTAKADSLRRARAALDSTVAQLTVAHAAGSPFDSAGVTHLVTQCYNALSLCDARVAAVERTDSLDRARADTAEQRAAVLDSSLARLLQVHDCHILWLRCPSRTALGLGGLGIGFVSGVLLSH